MIPNIHIHEQLMFERCQERQRAADQQRLVAGLRWSRSSLTRRLAGKLGVLLVALGTSVQRLALSGKQVVHDQGNGQ
jgi:hypothetical protein